MDVDVVIAGGGPFGLMLAIELGRRGVSVALFDAKKGTAFNPQANATQARTMEYFRRLGFADEIRKLGLPGDYPTDIAYFTRYASHELGRFRLPAARDAGQMVRSNEGSWTASEAPHRVSQKFVEPVLLRHAGALDGVTVSFGWMLERFESDDDRVTCHVRRTDGSDTRTLTARYLVGGDGARSTVRRALGVSYEGDFGTERNFMGGRMYAVYLRCPDFYRQTGKSPAWMNWTFNPERRAFMAAVDGKGEFAFHTQLRQDEREDDLSDDDARHLFHEACGQVIDCEILDHMGWTAGHALVAERFGAGRVLIGGDAAHLFTPAGGLGYNTAIEDAVNLGWKLAAVLQGRGGPALIASYEAERKASARRNTSYARGFADSVGNYVPAPDIEAQGAAGDALRAAAGAYLEDHARREFNIPGVTFGTRYDGSPILPPSAEPIPEDRANFYAATAKPGGRPPHWWFEDGRSLFDLFGFGWTLLRLDPGVIDGQEIIAAATARGLDLSLADASEPRLLALYGAPLALIRPDQIVAWRGDGVADADALLGRLLGWGG